MSHIRDHAWDEMLTRAVPTEFDHLAWQDWFHDNWQVSVWVVVVYVSAVAYGQNFMAARKRMELRNVLVTWNLLLAVVCFGGTLSHFYTVIRLAFELGPGELLCEGGLARRRHIGFWSFIMSALKVLELGDTAFIVLRKQKLIFLHWYHHALTLVLTWWIYGTSPGLAIVNSGINFFIHTVMYSYYAARAMKILIPPTVNKVITSLQIVQMVLCLAALVYVWNRHYYDTACANSRPFMISNFIMYFSYLVLFTNFYFQTYVLKKKDSHHMISSGKMVNGLQKKGD